MVKAIARFWPPGLPPACVHSPIAVDIPKHVLKVILGQAREKVPFYPIPSVVATFDLDRAVLMDGLLPCDQFAVRPFGFRRVEVAAQDPRQGGRL